MTDDEILQAAKAIEKRRAAASRLDGLKRRGRTVTLQYEDGVRMIYSSGPQGTSGGAAMTYGYIGTVNVDDLVAFLLTQEEFKQ